MDVQRLRAEDLGWAIDVLGQRIKHLVPYAPIFWAPAPDRVEKHTNYLRYLLAEGGALGYRTEESVLIAARERDHRLVDDAAWHGSDGRRLWDALAADCADESVRVVCPRYEPERLAVFQDAGLRVQETWWLRELPGSSGGTPGIDVELPGATAFTMPAPPVYAPPGPILTLASYDDLDAAAPAAVSKAEQLGCAGIVVKVPGVDDSAVAPLGAAGLRAHCDFHEGVVRPIRV